MHACDHATLVEAHELGVVIESVAIEQHDRITHPKPQHTHRMATRERGQFDFRVRGETGVHMQTRRAHGGSVANGECKVFGIGISNIGAGDSEVAEGRTRVPGR